MTAVSTVPGAVQTSADARWAWTGIGLVLALAAVGIWTGNVVEHQFRDSFTTLPVHERAFPGPVHTVDLSVQRGTVLIERTRSSTATVRTSGTRSVRVPTDHEAVTAGTLHVGSTCGAPTANANFCRRDYVVDVPVGTTVVAAVGTGNLELLRLSGTVKAAVATGSILVSHATGKVEATADTGQITVDSAGGPLSLHDASGVVAVYGASTRVTMTVDTGALTGAGLSSPTVSATAATGSVSLEFEKPPEHVVASTQTGSVTVLLPVGAPSYRLELSSATGTVTAGISSDPASTRTVRATSGNGDVRVVAGAVPPGPKGPFEPVRPNIPVNPPG